MATFGNGRRVAIVAGVRTPFAKAGTAFKSISAIDLGKLCVAELLQRTNLDGKEVQALVFGTVVPSVVEPNIAREVSLMPLLPKGVQAYTVSRACASANQAITDAADQIALGHLDVAIAGGSESLSNIPILHSKRFAETLVLASKAKSLPARLRILARLRPRDFIPITPAIAEPTTGGTKHFDGQWLHFEVPIPTTYNPGNNPNNWWWSMKYLITPAGTANDTFAIAIGLKGNPAHLLIS